MHLTLEVWRYVYNVANGALVPCVTRSSANMILTMQNNLVLVLISTTCTLLALQNDRKWKYLKINQASQVWKFLLKTRPMAIIWISVPASVFMHMCALRINLMFFLSNGWFKTRNIQVNTTWLTCYSASSANYCSDFSAVWPQYLSNGATSVLHWAINSVPYQTMQSCQIYSEYFQEPHWNSMGLPEISTLTWLESSYHVITGSECNW